MKKITIEISDSLYKELIETRQLESSYSGSKIEPPLEKFIIETLKFALHEIKEGIRSDILSNSYEGFNEK